MQPWKESMKRWKKYSISALWNIKVISTAHWKIKSKRKMQEEIQIIQMYNGKKEYNLLKRFIEAWCKMKRRQVN